MAAYDPNNIIGSLLPRVNFKKITLESAADADQLIVIVDLVIKEILDPKNPVSSWYENQDFSRFLDVGIIQVTSKTKIDEFSETRFSFMKMLKDAPVSPEMHNAGLDMSEVGWSTIDGSMTYKNIPLTDQNQVPIQDLSYVTDNDGNRIYTINYTTQFTVSSKNPTHLAYFADVMLDVDAIKDEFGLNEDLDFPGNNNPSSEIVIENGKIKSTTHVFITQDGDLWPGPVHHHSAEGPALPDSYIGWMGGATMESTLQPRLTMKAVPNNVVQDFRSIDRAIGNVSDIFSYISLPGQGPAPGYPLTGKSILSKAGTDLIKIIKTFIANQEYKHVGEPSYFTKLHVSKDPHGRARLLFGLDEKKLMIERSKYGKLYIYGGNYSNLVDHGAFDLKSIRMLRNRVNKYQQGDEQSVLFDHNESDDPHVDDKKMINYEVGNWNLEELSDTIQEINIHTGNAEGVRYFVATDHKVAAEERGFYQYGVELEYEDNTIDYLRDKVKVIDRLINGAPGPEFGTEDVQDNFRTYHEQSKNLGMNQFFKVSADPHIETPVGFDPAGQTSANGQPAFNVASNTFNKWFIDEFSEKFGPGGDETNRPNMLAINAFLLLLQDLGYDSVDLLHLFWTLQGASDPETGSPASIEKVINIIETVLSQIRQLLGVSYTSMPANDTSALGVSKSTSARTLIEPKRLIKIQKWFRFAEEIFDASEENGVGYDFLSLTGNFSPSNFHGPAVITPEYYINRVDTETDKYFIEQAETLNYSEFSDISDTVDATKYSYLSPSFIRLGVNNIYTNQRRMDSDSSAYDISEKKYYKNIGSIILAKNSTDKKISELVGLVSKKPGKSPSSGGTKSVSAAAAALAQVFAEKGCIAYVGEISPPFNPVNLDDTGFSMEIHSTDELIEKERDFDLFKGNEGVEAAEDIYTMTTFPAYTGHGKTISPLDMGWLDTISEGVGNIASSMMTDALLNGPNHLKSLKSNSHGIRSTFASNSKYNDPSAAPRFYMNYENLMKIEYLYQFKDGNIADPEWRPLKKQHLSGGSGYKGVYLCRMKRYEEGWYNINEKTAMKLPIFDQYFIIYHQPPYSIAFTEAPPQPGTGPIMAELSAGGFGNSEYTHGNTGMYKNTEKAAVVVSPLETSTPQTPGGYNI